MEYLLKPLISQLVSTAFDILKAQHGGDSYDHADIESLLPAQIRETLNWAEDVQVYGMTRPKEVGSKTVPLAVDVIPRKFRGPQANSPKIEEKELLSSDRHILLLGDPGSGKTTLIKRLVNHIVREEPLSEGDDWNYPIVVRLRTIDSDEPIAKIIADKLGIEYTTKEEKAGGGKIKMRYVLGGKPIESAVANVIDATRGILFLDGLDEAPTRSRDKLEYSIQKLALNMDHGKILISCRSGDYRSLQGFSVYELCPLDDGQIEEISRRWISDSENFKKALKAAPYQDLASRPLFLCQLMLLYANTGYLPERPATVYRSTVRLMLEDWDRRRGVSRTSKYSEFSPDDKHEFLSALSHELTYKLKRKIFSTDDLCTTYRQINYHFGLPKNEARIVAEEIETHTGIIIQGGPDNYEFSHLSLQEYLCAYYLVRDPLSSLMALYLREYPAPVAVAVGLAANPGNWLSHLILDCELNMDSHTIKSLLSRLLQERPRFQISLGLGLAILALCFEAHEGLEEFRYLLGDAHVKESLRKALAFYESDDSSEDPSLVRLVLEVEDDGLLIGWEPRSVGYVSHSLYRMLSQC